MYVLYMCRHTCVSLCVPHAHRCLQSLEGIISPGIGATGSCELPNMVAGKQTWIYCKSSKHLTAKPFLSSLSGRLFNDANPVVLHCFC